MDPEETKAIIEAAGGDTAFGKLLGIDGVPRYQQRINNWKRRGMPSDVVLDHYEVVKRLQEQRKSEFRA